jgi:hypothetical protein
VIREIQRRRDAMLVEVVSDFRSIWDNGFAASCGYRFAVNEITDVFLYTASVIAASAALGRSELFVASEAEVQESAVLDGRIVQHHHFMYAAATQRALSALIAPYGIRLGSLLWPLYSVQVQQLLWSRYPDLADLQYSCWRVGLDQKTCSDCEQCYRTSMTALASGDDPQRMGIDLAKVLAFSPSWETMATDRELATSPLPQKVAARRANQRVYTSVRNVSVQHLVNLLSQRMGEGAMSPEAREALATFREFQSRAQQTADSCVGTQQAFFEWLDPSLRDRLVAIYMSHFPGEPRETHAGAFLRSRVVADRMISALL